MPQGPSRSRIACIGIDTGGTFTDVVAVRFDGSATVFKLPSRPDAPEEPIREALRLLQPASGASLHHGTTVGTNALLQRRGARTALITSRGCKDVLEIGRQARAQLYELEPRQAAPLIPSSDRFELDARLDADGKEVTALDPLEIADIADAIKLAGFESAAVVLPFSFLDPRQEQTIGNALAARDIPVSLSCCVSPQIREYERTATTCADAFIRPVVSDYLSRLASIARESEISSVLVMMSCGSLIGICGAVRSPITTVLSGPAGGVVACQRLMADAGLKTAVAFDMGGTSTDVCVVDARLKAASSGRVADLPLQTPTLPIHTIGSGGGSLVWVDDGGALRCGPQSAGANPGPVAYGLGDQITVTDAHVLLGRIPSCVAMAGSLPLQVGRVRDAFRELSKVLGLSAEAASEGIISVASAQMARAVRHVSVEQGRDISSLSLIAYGGAGGLHACAVAEAAGLGDVVIPPVPGAFSALGVALARPGRSFIQSCLYSADANGCLAASQRLLDLRARARQELRDEAGRRRVSVAAHAEVRYVGQSHSLRIPFGADARRLTSSFHRVHRKRYGHADISRECEITAVAITLTVLADGLAAVVAPQAMPDRTQTETETETEVYTDAAWRLVPLHARTALLAGHQVEGPAVIVQADSTTFVEPNWQGAVDSWGNLRLKRRLAATTAA